MLSPPFGGLQKCSVSGKIGLYAARIPWKGKPMGGAFGLTVGEKT